MSTNIIVVGDSGAGKSALCNTVSQTTSFLEGESSVAVTTQNQKVTFNIDGTQVNIVDTIGLDDINLSTTSILQTIARGCTELLNSRINVLFYVINTRVTPRHVQQLNEIQQTIFSPSIRNFTTVIRTRFTSFQDPNAVAADEEIMRQQIPQIFQLCRRIIYVNNDSNNYNGHRLDSGTRLRVYISQLSDSPPYSEQINTAPISFQERDEAIRVKQQQELERQRQEEQRRKAEEERLRREQEEQNRRYQAEMARQRAEIEELKRKQAAEIASLGAARSTGGAYREYQVQSTSTGKYYKLSGTGSFNIAGAALNLNGNWTLSQQDYSFGGLETVVGDVQDLNIKGNITVNTNLTVRNLNVG